MEEKVIKRFEGSSLIELQNAIRARRVKAENLNDNSAIEEYSHLQISQEDTSPLELVITLGNRGAYAGTNSRYMKTPYDKIQSNNHLDGIIRGVLNRVPPGDVSQQRCVYHSGLRKIWLGSATVIENINESGESFYEPSSDLNDLLKKARNLAKENPTAGIIFNTRLIHQIGGVANAMGHYETFILKPTAINGYSLMHRDSHMSDSLFDYTDDLSTPIKAFAEAAGFVINNAEAELPRYNQNGLSCGPSAVGEVIDFLLHADNRVYDGFLKKEEGIRRYYDDTNEAYLDAEGKALTREDFMRLYLHYFLVDQEDNPDLQKEMYLTPNGFNCYLRKRDDHSTTYPVPGYVLEQYAKDAYPELFPSPSSINVISSAPTHHAESHVLADVTDAHRDAPVESGSGDLPDNPSPPSTGIVSTHPDFEANNLTNRNRGIIHAKTEPQSQYCAHFLFAVLTPRITRYGGLLVCLVGMAALGIAISAFYANPVGLALINALAISAGTAVLISANTAAVGAGLSLYGFLSSKKSPDNNSSSQNQFSLCLDVK